MQAELIHVDGHGRPGEHLCVTGLMGFAGQGVEIPGIRVQVLMVLYDVVPEPQHLDVTVAYTTRTALDALAGQHFQASTSAAGSVVYAR